ncbi:hypothetical protein PSEUDO8AS_40277 [Pseudomonas sp. 8AS]|nr:hypothetical protein PSEUDO8AS_40277 [Pseudomonas sp. 8AS]
MFWQPETAASMANSRMFLFIS